MKVGQRLLRVAYVAPALDSSSLSRNQRYGQVVMEVRARPAPAWQLLKTRFLSSLTVAKIFIDPVWYFYIFWIPKYLSTVHHFDLAQDSSEGGAVAHQFLEVLLALHIFVADVFVLEAFAQVRHGRSAGSKGVR